MTKQNELNLEKNLFNKPKTLIFSGNDCSVKKASFFKNDKLYINTDKIAQMMKAAKVA